NWPATSSMTTHWGSFEPLARDAKVAAGIPMTTASRASRIAAQGCQYAPIQRVISHHNTTVAAEAQVPGPGRSRPMPKKVATNSAQRGAIAAASSRMSLLEPALENSALCFIDSSAGVLAGRRAGVPPATSACATHPPPVRRWYPAPETKSHSRRLPTFLNQFSGTVRCRRETQNLCSLPISCMWGSVASEIACEAWRLHNFGHQIVIVSFGNLASIEFASDQLELIWGIIHEDLAINFRSVHCGAAFKQQIAFLGGSFEQEIEFFAN